MVAAAAAATSSRNFDATIVGHWNFNLQGGKIYL
jgi:hypothetical protein